MKQNDETPVNPLANKQVYKFLNITFMDWIPKTLRSILFLVFVIAICLLIAFVGVRSFTNKVTDIQQRENNH
ncbi:hypothetical protein H8S90_09000 [Olivibacter sp. SDN3]|uniref:hypothetical protein n=1 Tax=Olivibacter sp. SDN3 TaxID=2764720 RepID=UPI0016513D30|nr:hypothetical protein [Olivibacter sp. SDN3]QNL51688.1 hypothetical protein H8S90_09000 [Olivibacter sp. SDN3]